MVIEKPEKDICNAGRIIETEEKNHMNFHAKDGF